MKTLSVLTAFVAALVLGSVGCKGPRAAAAQPTLAPEVSEQIIAVLDAYEEMRAALAGDRHDAVPGLSKKIATTVKSAEKKAPQEVSLRLNEMATAAINMASEKNTELQRKAFGDLSRAAVSLIVAQPSLAKGRHIFHCPMAQGYPKWVQTDDEMKNPYMGKKMLRCGTKSEWKL
jgi:membrane fusion protein, copper/silver efflux system